MQTHFIATVNKIMLAITFLIIGYTGSFAQDPNSDTTTTFSEIVMLNPYETITYINNYREKYCKRNNKKHTKSIFLNTEYFNFIGEYFKDHTSKEDDGVRILFASYNKILDKKPPIGQAHPKQITIILAATKNKMAYLDSFNKYADRMVLSKGFNKDALNHGELCPNSCDMSTSLDATTSVTSTGPKQVPLVFLDPETAKQYINNYRRRYCRAGNKKHTKSIWIRKENFELLYEFFKNDASTKKFAGIRVFFASYNKYIDEANNAKRKQITLIFTAALNNPTHEPDFSALYDFGRRSKKNPDRLVIKSENHGELCPNSCNNEIFDHL